MATEENRLDPILNDLLQPRDHQIGIDIATSVYRENSRFRDYIANAMSNTDLSASTRIDAANILTNMMVSTPRSEVSMFQQQYMLNPDLSESFNSRLPDNLGMQEITSSSEITPSYSSSTSTRVRERTLEDKIHSDLKTLYSRFEIEIEQRDATQKQMYNKNGYNHNMQKLLQNYFYPQLTGKKNTRYLSIAFDQLTKEFMIAIFEDYIKIEYKKLFDKDLETSMKVSKVEIVEDGVTEFHITIETNYHNIILKFVTNFSYESFSQRSMHHSNKNLTTYDLIMELNQKEKLSYNSGVDFSRSTAELERQSRPEAYIHNSSVGNKPNLFIELRQQRREIDMVEKLFSFLKTNKNYFEDIIRIYLNRNELISFLYMSKTMLNQKCINNLNCDYHLNKNTNIICNLIDIVKY